MNAAAVAVMESVQGPVPVLTDVKAAATIKDLLAEVEVTQCYRNAEAVNVEAVYTFPIPVDGVLLGFDVEIGDRKLTGQVVEKADAERQYEEAITDGDAAVMLEQSGPGLYTASVGNLLPGESASIRFRYGLLLRWNGDRVRFMMPTTIAPRYGDPSGAGMQPHQIPEFSFDAERSFHLAVTVKGLLQGARFNSPSHGVKIESRAEETVIEFTGKPAMDRDFILEAHSLQTEASGALVSRDLDGWVAMASFRPSFAESTADERRSTKIVVDCSGSMMGNSIAQARVALERILDGLRPGDFFDIVAFGTSSHGLFGREMPVSETSLAQARRFVRQLDANMGGTEIGGALAAAYRIADGASTSWNPAHWFGGAPGTSRDILLITDGEVWNTDAIIAQAKTSGHRIFTVGVGSAVAEAFVRQLAEATGGACELVSPREDMVNRIHRHFQRMFAPQAVKAEVRWRTSPVGVLPKVLDTIFDGDTIHAFAWFAQKPEGKVALIASLSNASTVTQTADAFEFEAEEDFAQEAPSTLARLAAAKRLIGDWESRAAADLALRYQLMSQWTNYLVVHVRAEGEKAADLPAIRKVAQVTAAGWHGMGSALSEMTPNYLVAGTAARCEPPSPYADPFGDNAVADDRFARRRQSSSALVGALTPAELVAILNAREAAPLPDLEELVQWGVPGPILKAMRALVEGGAKEEATVAAFLQTVARSSVGSLLERQARRQIVRSSKLCSVEDWVLARIRAAIESCAGWEDIMSESIATPTTL